MKTKKEYQEIHSDLCVTKGNLIEVLVICIGLILLCGGGILYMLKSAANDRTILDTQPVGRIIDVQFTSWVSLVKTEQGSYSIHGHISYDNDEAYVIHSLHGGESLLCPEKAWVAKGYWDGSDLNPACHILIAQR